MLNDESPPRASREAGNPLPSVDRPPSLAEYVCVVLRDDILAGRLVPGERLSEAFITDRTGVSRSPVREAIRLLQAEGLVNSERGRGTYVSYRLSSEEAQRIYRCRLAIEPYMTSLAAERATRNDVRRCEEILDRFSDAVDRSSDSRTISAIDGEFHSAIYDASDCPLEVIFRSYWSRLQLQLSTLVYDRETPARFYDEHVMILAAIRDGDGAAADTLMAAHIEHGERRIEESFAERGDL